jgi:hypothetical protein
MKTPLNRNMSAAGSVVLLVFIVAAAWFLPPKQSWPAVFLLLIAFFLLLGLLISERPLGVLVNEQNVMSLSRFQTALWTLIVISAFLVIAVARIKNGVMGDEEGIQGSDPLNITIGSQLLALVGISAASLVGSPMVAATKKSKPRDDKAIAATAKEMARTGNAPDSAMEPAPKVAPSTSSEAIGEPPAAPVLDAEHIAAVIKRNAEGTLYKNPSVKDASFTDLFEGNEVGNAGHVDLSKVQMFFFTVIVAVAYAVALWDILSEGAIYDASFKFPVVTNGMVALLGISNAGYLTSKGIRHS